VGRCLRKHGSSAEVVLADPVGSRLARWIEAGTLDGVDAPYAVEGIGQSVPPPNLDRQVVSRAISVSDAESFATCRRLRDEEGLFVGGSSGTAVAAAIAVARHARGPVVVILADRGESYASTPWMRAWA
jgi:cystathionine beta-synthase